MFLCEKNQSRAENQFRETYSHSVFAHSVAFLRWNKVKFPKITLCISFICSESHTASHHRNVYQRLTSSSVTEKKFFTWSFSASSYRFMCLLFFLQMWFHSTKKKKRTIPPDEPPKKDLIPVIWMFSFRFDMCWKRLKEMKSVSEFEHYWKHFWRFKYKTQLNIQQRASFLMQF